MKQLLFTSACVLGLIASMSASNAKAVDPNIPGFDGDSTSPTIVQKNTYNAATDGGAVYYGGTGLNGTTNGNTNPTMVATGSNGGPTGTNGGPTGSTGGPTGSMGGNGGANQPAIDDPLCPAGEPRVYAYFTTLVQNFTYRSIYGSGASSILVARITVPAGASTIASTILPSFGFVQDDTTVFSNRTVTLSQKCADFSSSAKVIMSNQLGGAMTFGISGDPRITTSIGGFGAPVYGMSPGVWYINVRNDTCPDGENCSISGIWRNFNR